MRTIYPELTDELLDHFGDPRRIASAAPFRVNTFRELVEHTAKLSFKNKDYLLFYRGQSKDYKNKAGSSTFYPSIYRGDNLPLREITNRFDILDGASKALVDLFEQNEIEGHRELKRRKSIQWSVLQHYEVCQTPFLDFTHSLRVACSFAALDNKAASALVFVFGLPYLTNRISINSEHDIINIRLLSICPPSALRPYFQEGYLVGTDDITTNYDPKTELDFKNRLIAKFEIPNDNHFWGDGLHKIPKSFLYPENDPVLKLVQKIRDLAERELKSGDIGEFLKGWAELEEKIVSGARSITQRNLSVREGINTLFKNQRISEEWLPMLEQLRKFRNNLVHTPKFVNPNDIKDALSNLEEISKKLPKRF